MTSWYAHINDTLYGRYTAILSQQSSGQLTLTQAGAAMTAEKAFPDAFKVFLDGQAASLSGASPACNYARQTLGLAAGYLGLMEGWGGLILTYGPTPTYLSSREDASNKYFEFMSESLGHIANCSGSASGGGTPPALPPPSTPALSTPTPTFQPTATPPSGGSTGCLARSVTWDWELCVRESYLDLFEIRVTALTEDATDSSFKIRVYAPDDFLGTDSSTKWPFYVGQTFRLDYGFDFFEYEPYPVGIYEIELRVDFLRETRVYINVY
ncbi:MAG: hypothetical protein M5U18_02465 [Dehalococcoidia bacterium]|nr:hypothetical protein [Dehalococcoidia bacterium]